MEELDKRPSIEGFYNHCEKGELMFVECSICGSRFGAPREICAKCGSKEVKWNKSEGEGTLLSYTIIHVPPPEFKDETPYPVGIVELNEGFRLLSLIKGAILEEIKIGMKLKAGFEKHERKEWPYWGRYHFTPLSKQ